MRTPDERREVMRERVASWARRLNVQPRQVRVQYMTRKWGSCSTAGVVTLAADLADQDLGFQDFVIVHELLHLRVPNHGKLFNSLANGSRARLANIRHTARLSAHQRQAPHLNKRTRCQAIKVNPRSHRSPASVAPVPDESVAASR